MLEGHIVTTRTIGQVLIDTTIMTMSYERMVAAIYFGTEEERAAASEALQILLMWDRQRKPIRMRGFLEQTS